jgi:rod shape-determining protein MreD
VAVAGGLLLDIGGQGPLGVHALALLAAAGVTGLVTSRSDPASLPAGALVTVPATIAYSIVVLAAAQLLRQPLPSPAVAAALVMAGAAYQVVLSVPILLSLRGRARMAAW